MIFIVNCNYNTYFFKIDKTIYITKTMAQHG